MKNRLLNEGLTTTIIGIIILIFAGYMWASAKATNNEAIV
jgi:hypothetical protein